MSQNKVELELAWEEVSFWQDFVIKCKTEQDTLPEPRVLEALEKAWRRYESALQQRQRPMAT
jgi:hypothetical protein